MVTLYRYGDVFSFNLIEMHQIVICDLELLREMFSKEAFSARGKPTVFGINLFALLKGGHGGHGLMFNEGIVGIVICTVYRDRLKCVQILLSRTQAGPGRKVKQEQEQIP